MINRILLIFIISISFVTSTSAQQNDNQITIGTKHKINSTVLNEEREIWIYLPANHTPNGNYPVMYVLDGDRSFTYSSGLVRQFAENGKMPNIILVGILNTNRDRDLSPTHVEKDFRGNPQPFLKTTGGGDTFLKFMRTELAPYIEKNYTSSKFRIFTGHSLGGLMAVHALLEHSDFYNAFIAIDPSLWWDDGIMIKRLTQQLTKKRNTKNTFYMSSANNDNADGNFMLPPQIEFMEKLAKWDSHTLNSKRDYYDQDHHGSVDLISFYNGLEFIFKNYNFSFDEAVNDPSFINNHFTAFSNQIGYKFKPSEAIINRLAYTYLHDKKDSEKALELFLENTQKHPNSANAFDSLSDVYKVIGNKEMAIKSLERALEIDPNFPPSIRKLKEIKGE